MKILFFIVHPAKFHLFKNIFRRLEKLGIQYEIVISQKDVLAELLKEEGFEFTNLFPGGRKIKHVPILINAALNLSRTLFRLLKFIKNKKYDLFITDDVLTIIGKLKNTPSLIYCDNDLITIPRLKLLFRTADYIMAPSSTDMGEFNYKKKSFKGNKALAHLSPDVYEPDKNKLYKYGLNNKRYCLLRLVNLNATHDVNQNVGLYDDALDEMIPQILKNYFLVISSERKISSKYEAYQLKINPADFSDLLAFSEFVVTDSGSVATEAAVLGVPNILVNSIAKLCGVLKELKEEYSLMDYYDYYDEARVSIFNLINHQNGKAEFKSRLNRYLINADDITEFFLNEILKYNPNKIDSVSR